MSQREERKEAKNENYETIVLRQSTKLPKEEVNDDLRKWLNINLAREIAQELIDKEYIIREERNDDEFITIEIKLPILVRKKGENNE